MNTLENITGLGEGQIHKLKKLGLFRSTVIRDYMMYDYFIEQNTETGIMQAITNTAEKFNISDDRVKNIIYKIRKADNTTWQTKKIK